MSRSPFSVRRDGDRGRFTNDWLDARFSFPFAGWSDPAWPRFGPLLALNEDRVQPGRGFAMHPHTDLEILMLPRAGRIEHRDDLGGHAIVAPGQVHFMRAGRGIRHSQMNPSAQAVDHHFQVWLAPRTRSMTPRVETLTLAPPEAGRWVTVASGAGDAGAAVDADAVVTWGRAGPGVPLHLPVRPGRSRYLHVMSGAVNVARAGTLGPGDALVLHDADAAIDLVATGDTAQAEVLGFDLPRVAAP